MPGNTCVHVHSSISAKMAAAERVLYILQETGSGLLLETKDMKVAI